MTNVKNKGFNLMEIIMVIAVISIISFLAISNLIDFKREQVLKNTTEEVISLLNKAKSNSSASLNSSNYSVHFETDRMVYFVGGTFNENDTNNQIFPFDDEVKIPVIGGLNLNGGGSNVIFPRLTENIIGYGTIVIQMASDSSRQKIITIEKTGAISYN